MLLPLPAVVPAQSPAYAEWLFCANAASLASPALLWVQKHEYWLFLLCYSPFSTLGNAIPNASDRFPRDDWESNQPQINVKRGRN